MKSTFSRPLVAALALAAGLVASSGAAEAYSCAVKPSRDGFAALRGGPSTSHPIIARMRAPELLDLMDPTTEDVVRRGDWVFVRYYPGSRRTPDATTGVVESRVREGWVHDSLVNCFQ